LIKKCILKKIKKMAIGPERLRENFKKEVDEFEEIIDSKLLKSKLPGKIMIDAPRGMTTSHFNVLKDRYLKSGWNVVKQEFGTQRDPGNLIIFSAEEENGTR
jgi:hypothetical protein